MIAPKLWLIACVAILYHPVPLEIHKILNNKCIEWDLIVINFSPMPYKSPLVLFDGMYSRAKMTLTRGNHKLPKTWILSKGLLGVFDDFASEHVGDAVSI